MIKRHQIHRILTIGPEPAGIIHVRRMNITPGPNPEPIIPQEPEILPHSVQEDPGTASEQQVHPGSDHPGVILIIPVQVTGVRLNHGQMQIPITTTVTGVRTVHLRGQEIPISEAVQVTAIHLPADRVVAIPEVRLTLVHHDPVIPADHLLLQEAVVPQEAVPEVEEDVNAQLTLRQQ